MPLERAVTAVEKIGDARDASRSDEAAETI
jgi:hypothetical protein